MHHSGLPLGEGDRLSDWAQDLFVINGGLGLLFITCFLDAVVDEWDPGLGKILWKKNRLRFQALDTWWYFIQVLVADLLLANNLQDKYIFFYINEWKIHPKSNTKEWKILFCWVSIFHPNFQILGHCLASRQTRKTVTGSSSSSHSCSGRHGADCAVLGQVDVEGEPRLELLARTSHQT